MNNYYLIEVPAHPQVNTQQNTFNPNQHVGWLVVASFLAILCNLGFSIIKTATDKKIIDVVHNEFKPVNAEIKTLKEILSNFNEKLIRLEADRNLLKTELTNASDRLENKLKEEKRLLDASIKELKVDILELQAKLRVSEETVNKLYTNVALLENETKK